MRASDLKKNQKSVILCVEEIDLEYVEKGFCKGNNIEMFKKGILGSYCFLINDLKVAIDSKIADKIKVKNIEN